VHEVFGSPSSRWIGRASACPGGRITRLQPGTSRLFTVYPIPIFMRERHVCPRLIFPFVLVVTEALRTVSGFLGGMPIVPEMGPPRNIPTGKGTTSSRTALGWLETRL